MTSPLHGVTTLTHLGVIRVEGEDAAQFLQGQLTQDFVLLSDTEARLAAFCNPKGRMQASFIGLRRPDGAILLVTSRDLLAATLKRLSMFVMRAKARLTDASDAWSLHGVAGDPVSALGVGPQPWDKVESGEASAVRLYPADGQQRALVIAPAGAAPPSGPALPLDHWLWGEVRSAVSTLTQPVFEAFVPQMLNYESIGGVNFKKGCYPGQEVIARSQFRGTLKRRAYLVHSATVLSAGQELFSADEAGQPCGTVVQAAAAPEGGWDALASMQVSAAQSGSRLALGSAEGPAIELQPLPYLLVADV